MNERMRPPIINEDQWTLAVTLLANAIRKDDHLRQRRDDALKRNPAGSALGASARANASEHYLRGMLDLLAVLFEGGRLLADDCHAAAKNLARGDQDGPSRDLVSPR
jgi:hypothetical protein